MCFLILGYVLTAPPITSFSSTFRRTQIAEFKPTSFVGPNFLLFSATHLLSFHIFLSIFYFQSQTLSSLTVQHAVVLQCRKTNDRETSKAGCSSRFGIWTSHIYSQHFTDTQKVIKMLYKIISTITLDTSFKTFFVSVVNMFLIYLFASMKLEMGH